MGSVEREDVYATLLLSDNYLPGALVLAHSLRDAGTTKKLAVLYTAETVSTEVVNLLKTVFDYDIPVKLIKNAKPANLHLMNRPDLHSAFTKINLWELTQFRKIVYIDADVLALRAPDELFDLPHPFSAAPDIGWPDIFNTGVMALTPNMGDYNALFAMAERGVSFDGADQGLLNMYFKDNFNRLSFTYNVTPSAHYQYVPAYRHFQSSINMVHFIGQQKPWTLGREAAKQDTLHSDMVGRWWSVYDQHYGNSKAPDLLRYFVRGEFNPSGEHKEGKASPHDEAHDYNKPPSHHFQDHHHQQPQAHYQSPDSSGSHHHGQCHHGDSQHWQAEHGRPYHTAYQPSPLEFSKSGQESQAEARVVQDPRTHSWDPQRHPPPTGSKPEAENLPHQHYGMSQDAAPFVPPPIFPWETHRPAPSRIFWDDNHVQNDSGKEPTEAPRGEVSGMPESQAPAEPSMTGSSVTVAKAPTAPKSKPIQTNIWSSFDRTNAWDDVPEIQRYAEKLETHQRRKNRLRPDKVAAGQLASEKPSDKRGPRVTDFPSEHDRPSLPVTPAPVRSKPKLWSALGDGELPAAQGVPSQADWDPIAQLQKLAKQQSEVVVHSSEESEGEYVTSQGEEAPKTSFTVLSPQPVKGAAATSIVQGMLDKVDSKAARAMGVPQPSSIPEPSYAGPGAAWERGEDVSAHVLSFPRT